MSTVIPSKPEFDDAIIKILQRPEYEHLKSGVRDFIEGMKEAIRQWILKLLKKAYGNIDISPSVPENLSKIFMIAGILVIFAIMIFIILKISKTFERRTRVKEILGEKIEEGTTPNSLRSKAFAYEKEGDFRQAVRYNFIALLLLMHEKNLLYLDETKTNEEIYTYLRRNSFPLLSSFQYLIDNFNYSWYGHKLLSSSIYDKWICNMELLWNGVIGYEEKSK